MSECECPPCPGRGNDGHGLTHCAECCYGTGVEADIDCPVHGQPATPDDLETLAEVVLPALPNHCCDPGDLTDCPYDAHDAGGIARAVLVSDWLADRLAAARREGADAALAPVEALAARWLTDAGPDSDAWRAFGEQVVRVPFAVKSIRAAIAQGRDAAKGDAS